MGICLSGVSELKLPEFECPGHFKEWLDRNHTRLGEISRKDRKFLELCAEQYDATYGQTKAMSPIYHFRPNFPQALLLYQLNRQQQMPRIMMLEGSNKCGKSTLAVAWQLSLGVGQFPWLNPRKKYTWVNGKKYWHFDYSKRWKEYRLINEYLGFKDYDDLSDRFFDLKKLCPKLKIPNVNIALGETYTESVDKDLVPKYVGNTGLIPESWKPKSKKNQQGVVARIRLEAGPGRGSVFHFRSYKSPSDEFEGIDASGSILFNEPPPRDIVTAVNRGALPFDTRAMYAYTALKEAWLYRDYVNRSSRWLV